MSLTIDPATSETHNTNNPYALTPYEISLVNHWALMSDDEKGEYLHRAKLEENIANYIAQDDLHRATNDHAIQRLSSGNTVIGGMLHPETLVTLGGVEMTVNQAVDLGLYSPDALTAHTMDTK